MRWTKVNDHWECVFVNVPFAVHIVRGKYKIESRLYFSVFNTVLTTSEYETVEDAKSDVENFVLNYLALYSAQVHRECLEANIMTWRKLRQQLNEIPEDQLDNLVRVLDSDGDWVGEPEIIKASQDMYKDCELGHDCTLSHGTDDELIVEEGNYYLSIEL